MCPREGHLLAMKKMYGYLKGHSKGRILFDARLWPVGQVEYMDGGN